MNNPSALLSMVLLMMFGCTSDASLQSQNRPDRGPIPVELVQEDGVWTLLRGGEPFVIRGAGGQDHLESLVRAGGNSIRTWDGEGIDDLLDRAHGLGLAVTVGIWLEHERHGYDYSDESFRDEQRAKVERIVNTYMDHPAVLMWGVGNEVELGGSFEVAVGAIEEAAAIVKRLDPNHPTIAVIAEIGDDKATRVLAECPSVDLIGVNAYGGAASIPERLTEQGFTGAYVMTEFGPRGHWEGPMTDWGAPIEPTGAEKLTMYENTYRSAVLSEQPGRCVGSYVFLWGQKQETTATWFGMFTEDGRPTSTVDAMHRLWTGTEPENAAPVVRSITMSVPPGFVPPGGAFGAAVDAEDPNGDPIRVRWVVKPESTDRRSGGDREHSPEELADLTIEVQGLSTTFRAPTAPGAYRLFAYATDESGAVGTANVPFRVR